MARWTPLSLQDLPARHLRSKLGSAARNRIARQIGIGLCCLVSISHCQAASVAQSKEKAPVVEFDLGSDQQTALATSKAIRFVVGYFSAEGLSGKPLFTYEMPGSQVTHAGTGSVDLPLHHWQAPAGQHQVIVRIRTVTAAGKSAWSTASGPVATDLLARLTPSSGESATERLTDPKAAARFGKIPGQLGTNAVLRSALERRFPGINLTEAASGYRSMSSFIAALCAASQLGLHFDELKPLTVAGQNKALEQALQTLKPSPDAAAQAKKAQREAREILKAASGRGQSPRPRSRKK